LEESLLQAAEAGDEAVQAGQGEDPVDRAIRRDDQPQPAAFSEGPRVRPDQDAKPGAIAEQGASHVYHDRDMPIGGHFEQDQA
jgi:hypothetical protein